MFTDVGAGTSITWLRKIDIFGTMVKELLSCCNEETITATETNFWALPETVTKGAAGGPQLTVITQFDFNTSEVNSQTDPNNLVTTINARDAALRPTLLTNPTNSTITASFGDATLSDSRSVNFNDGGVQKTITASKVYDGWGRSVQEIDGNNGQVNTTYDAMGHLQSRTNPFTPGGTPGPATTYQYDALGRMIVATLPDGNTIHNSYSGSALTSIDQVNRKIQRINDGLGRLVTVNEQDATGALIQGTTYTYDYLDNLTVVNQGNQFRSFKYDALSRLLYERIPEHTATINDGTGTFWTTKYTYTSFNAVATKQDSRGVVTTNGYEALNRLTTISYNTVSGVTTAPTVTYIYDTDATYGTTAKGKVVRVNIGSDYQERYTFDTNKRIASVIRTIGGRTYSVSHQYNEESQLTQLTYPSTRSINIGRDSQGRINALNDGLGTNYLGSVNYSVAGQVTGFTLGNGVVESFVYDPQRMQLISQKATKTTGGGIGYPPPPPPVTTTYLDLTYNYQSSAGQMGAGTTAGNTGQLMSIGGTINSATESAAYTYDLLGRLGTSNQTSNGQSAQRRFAYDRWGNRTGVYDPGNHDVQIQSITLEQSGGAPTNRITSVTAGATVNYSYDATGNVTNDGVHSYGYDSENRLVSIDGGAAAQYSYDHENHRYSKVAGGITTHYIWEGGQVLAEHNGSTGLVLVDYISSGNHVIGRVQSGSTQYFLSDRLSVRLVLDANGNVIGRQAHLPFGEDFAESGTQDKHHFTSYERDGESGVDYAVNRHMQSAMGRFLQADKAKGDVGSPQSWNRFTYNRNEPINLTDTNGLFFSVCWHSIIFGFTFLLDGVELPDYFWGIPAEFCIFIFFIIDRPRESSHCFITLRLRLLQKEGGAIGFLHMYILTESVIGFARFYYGAVPEGSPPNFGRLRATASIWGRGAGEDFLLPFIAEITEQVQEPCTNYNRTFTKSSQQSQPSQYFI